MVARVREVSIPAAHSLDAFDRLFVNEYRRVVAIAYRIVNDADEAEDIAQEAFAQLLRRHDPQSPFAPAWLHRAASHLALNAVRSRRRRSRRELNDFLSRGGTGDWSGLPGPEADVVRKERRAEVRAVLARLPKRAAQVLALRYAGLGYAEVAAAMKL